MTETACLSTIWETDEQVEEYLTVHGRSGDYLALHPDQVAYYDKAITLDLSMVTPMIAMPFHPSNVYSIAEFQKNAAEILAHVEESCNRQMEDFQLRLDLRSKLHRGRLIKESLRAVLAASLQTCAPQRTSCEAAVLA